ncbi:hypothetical protein [Actinoplanes sp. NPDC026619]|uniref:hypothetical protein n=1 Tax=Actinoplanes sp. NPDC026619 TaxID=3155798 RepID=UPI00340210A8
MAASRKDSQANLALIAELESAGVLGVTSRKLERWRQAGAAPDIEQESHGRAGSATRWPPHTGRQIAALVGLLKQQLPLRHCPLVLYHLGYPIDFGVLRAGYLEMYEDFAMRGRFVRFP